jgi:hypothetical protein
MREDLNTALDPEGGDGAWCIAAIKFFGHCRMAGIKPEQLRLVDGVNTEPKPAFDPNDPAYLAKLEKLREFKLWFGEHTGKLVSEIPENYLRWILWKCENKSNLHNACRNELRIRGTAKEQKEYANPIRS